jgi:acyl carrier protein
MMDSMPMTANGKLDRKSLPYPDKPRRDLDSPYVPPRTPIEYALAKIWAEILSQQQVGINDDFFALGGDSLSASRAVSKMAQTFGVELPLKTFFDAPTVAESATAIMQNQNRRQPHKEIEQIIGELEAMSKEDIKRELADWATTISDETKTTP